MGTIIPSQVTWVLGDSRLGPRLIITSDPRGSSVPFWHHVPVLPPASPPNRLETLVVLVVRTGIPTVDRFAPVAVSRPCRRLVTPSGTNCPRAHRGCPHLLRRQSPFFPDSPCPLVPRSSGLGREAGTRYPERW